MKFDIPAVGMGQGAEKKKQARDGLLSQGRFATCDSHDYHLSNFGKQLLSDIAEALGSLAIKFSTCAQPGSSEENEYQDLKLKLGGSRWSWHEPVGPRMTPTEYDGEDSSIRCLAQRRSSEAFAFLKHIIELHDKPVKIINL